MVMADEGSKTRRCGSSSAAYDVCSTLSLSRSSALVGCCGSVFAPAVHRLSDMLEEPSTLFYVLGDAQGFGGRLTEQGLLANLLKLSLKFLDATLRVRTILLFPFENMDLR
ncbi:hypothetical protein Taro_016592, partial [Colocasia esculenta]|nr:hypothetical protein [Colocasia esculenta]